MTKGITNYSFNAALRTITFNDYGSIAIERISAIKNLTTNAWIYKATDTANFGGSVTGNVFTFIAANTNMANGDKLFIKYDDDIETLPAGASTSAKQDTGNASLSSIDTKLNNQATAAKQDISNTALTSIDSKLNGPVPVSASALPLPSNAAQETGGNLAAIAGKDFATQTTLAAVLAKLSADPATQTTLAAILAKLTADPATQTTLAAILAKLISAPATEGKQDAMIALLTSIASISQPLTNTQLRVAPVEVSQSSQPLPIGAATSANQSTTNSSLTSLVTAMTILTNAINSNNQHKISLDDVAMLVKRALHAIERPPYMSSMGNLKVDLQTAGGSSFGGSAMPVTLSGGVVNTMGAAATDMSYVYYTQLRDAFNTFKNKIIS